MSWQLNEVKNFHKSFHDLVERGVRGRNKTSYYVIPSTNQINRGPLMAIPSWESIFNMAATKTH